MMKACVQLIYMRGLKCSNVDNKNKDPEVQVLQGEHAVATPPQLAQIGYPGNAGEFQA